MINAKTKRRMKDNDDHVYNQIEAHIVHHHHVNMVKQYLVIVYIHYFSINSKMINADCRALDSGALDTKGGMVFITLTDTSPDGSPWTMKQQDLMCGRWSAVSHLAAIVLSF